MADRALTCPDCLVELAAVTSRDVIAHRCGRCRGVWLGPDAFRQICEQEEAGPEEDAALVRAVAPVDRRAAIDDRIKYRACPGCRDVMNRTNFAKVSGVVIDVCKSHGAWFDRGELASIRAFLRAGGAGRFERHRKLMDERKTSRPGGAAPRGTGPPADIYDVLIGGGTWDVPSRFPRLLLAGMFAVIGAWSLWRAFHPDYQSFRSLGLAPVLFGIACFYFAWRALEQWRSQRGR